LFGASVEAALERGSASLVLLKRKLGVGYARAAALMEALVEEGILGEMTASGSRPTLITAAEWGRRGGR
jgi:S-DNA-T family DNA segregation ATPase FtsK/SpoIIIE